MTSRNIRHCMWGLLYYGDEEVDRRIWYAVSGHACCRDEHICRRISSLLVHDVYVLCAYETGAAMCE